MAVNEIKIATIVLKLQNENNHQHLRGKKRVTESIERYVLAPCNATRRVSGEFELKIPYYTNSGLDKIVGNLLQEIREKASIKHCFSASVARFEGTDRQW